MSIRTAVLFRLLGSAMLTFDMGCSCGSSEASMQVADARTDDAGLEAAVRDALTADADAEISLNATCRMQAAPATPLCSGAQCPIVSDRFVQCSRSGFGVSIAHSEPHPWLALTTNQGGFHGHVLSGPNLESTSDPCEPGIAHVISDSAGAPRILVNTPDSRQLATCVLEGGSWRREVIPTPTTVDFPLARTGWMLADGAVGVLFGAPQSAVHVATREVAGSWSERVLTPISAGRSTVTREGQTVSMAYWAWNATLQQRELFAVVDNGVPEILGTDPGNLDSGNPITLALRGDQRVATVATNDPQNNDELLVVASGSVIRVPDTAELTDRGCPEPTDCRARPLCTHRGFAGVGSAHALARLPDGNLALLYVVEYVDVDIQFDVICSEPGCTCARREIANRGHTELRIARIRSDGTAIETPTAFRLSATPETIAFDQEGAVIELALVYRQSEGPRIQVLRLDARRI